MVVPANLHTMFPSQLKDVEAPTVLGVQNSLLQQHLGLQGLPASSVLDPAALPMLYYPAIAVHSPSPLLLVPQPMLLQQQQPQVLQQMQLLAQQPVFPPTVQAQHNSVSPMAAQPINTHTALTELGSTLRKAEDAYVDVLQLAPIPVDNVSPPEGRRHQFPYTLYQLICECPDDIASFSPNGQWFGIFNTERFVKQVLSPHSQQTKFASLDRQLHLYGFQKLRQPNGIWYRHELFRRGHPEFLDYMRRVRARKRSS